MLSLRNLPASVLVIPQFEPLATASIATFGAASAPVISIQEDADEITGEPLDAEADRVACLLLGIEVPAALQAAE